MSISGEILSLIKQYAIQYGLPYDYVRRQVDTESGGDPNAVGGIGEIGLMQISPMLATDLIAAGIISISKDLYDPAKNLNAGCWKLSHLLAGMKTQAPELSADDAYRLALVSYNGGPGYVKQAIKQLRARNAAVNYASVLEELPTAYVSGRTVQVAMVTSYNERIVGRTDTMLAQGRTNFPAGITPASAASTSGAPGSDKGPKALTWLALAGATYLAWRHLFN